jgi:hypothetical protein
MTYLHIVTHTECHYVVGIFSDTYIYGTYFLTYLQILTGSLIGVLTPTSEIARVFTWYARESQCIDQASVRALPARLRWCPRGVAWDAVPESMVEYIRPIFLKVTGPIPEVRSWIEKMVLSVNKPDSISFISFRFSRTDVATWMSNATAQAPFPDFHFEGYIQSKTAIALHRLH